MRLYRLAADQGYDTAQSILGVMYSNGTGVPQDHTEAARLYRLAADQGDAKAQSNLGIMYEDGIGVPQDHTEAVRLYQLAADQGNSYAQCNLAVMYKNGTGVPQDHTEEVRLFQLAADEGFQPARDALGRLTAMYPAGTQVRITGHVEPLARLNGMVGTAVQPIKPLVTGRIAVQIDGQTKSVSLSWANVQHV